MKSRLFPIVACLALLAAVGCKDPDAQAAAQPAERPAPASIGLFSPVQLGIDSTEVFLEDYFPQGDLPDSIAMHPALDWRFDSATHRIVVGRPGDGLPWLSTLDLWFGRHAYNILVRKAREVRVTLRYDPKGKAHEKVQYAGEINGWNPETGPMHLVDGIWEAELWLNPGRYQYQVVVDGNWMLDPANPVKVDNNIGGWNSELRVGDGMGRSIPDEELHISTDTSGILYIDPRLSDSTLPDLRADQIFVFWGNRRIDVHVASNGRFLLNLKGAANPRSYLRIYAASDKFWTNDRLIPLDHGRPVLSTRGLDPQDHHQNIIYFLLVDRFANGDPANDRPLRDPRVDARADYHGGDLVGVTQKIREGYFDSLGVNMLWISPVNQNPEQAYQEYPEPRRWFSGYHGYWPVSSTRVDHRFGGDQALTDLVREAHAHGIKVILDYVANHLHEEHPMIQAHPEWKTELYLEDSVLNVRLWDTHRIGTWFDTFMPSLDYSKPEVVEFQTDSALYWVQHFGLDGFRQDATKHIPTHFWRRLTQKLKLKHMLPQGRELYQVGETFGSRELIGSYVGSGLLNGQFDFNYYWSMRAVFGGMEKDPARLLESLRASETAYGSHSLMGNITGNHDMPRFIALAGGAISPSENPKEAGWSREVKLQDPDGYKRLQLLQAWLLMGPGVPVIYYGDEIGMVGADDPDNRRDMRFSGLSPEETETKAIVSKLIQLRRSRMALIYGATQLYVQGNVVAMRRQHLTKPTWLVANLGKAEARFHFSPGLWQPRDLLFRHGWLDSWDLVLPGLSFDVVE